MKKLVFWVLIIILMTGFSSPVSADCPDTSIGCYKVDTRYVPYQSSQRYLFQGTVSVGRCWQWWFPGCVWCPGKTVMSVAQDCIAKYPQITFPTNEIRNACASSSFPAYGTCEILGSPDGGH